MKTMVSKRTKSAFAMTMAGIAILTVLSLAEARTYSSEDEARLDRGIMLLNNNAKIPDGDRIAADQLAEEFGLSQERISALRERDLEYGEIAAVLAMADSMDGGVNEANVNSIMELRENAAPWPEIASSADLELGGIANRVSQVEDRVHREIKSPDTGRSSSGKAAGGTSGTPSTSNERDVGAAGSDY